MTRLAFSAQAQEDELRAYLGDAYDRSRLERWDELIGEELVDIPGEDEFYRQSQSYLYNLTAFAMTATKLPYLNAFTEHVPPGSRVLDYGCGIGADGLLLLDAGYRVEFADFDNPSTEYLRWRLERRGLDAPIHDLDKEVPGGFDAAYSLDVIEHVPEPYAFLGEMEQRAQRVMVNLLEFDPNEQELHYELPIPDLLKHAAGRGLEHYRVYHGSSHLVLYDRDPVGAAARTRNRLRIAVEGQRPRVRQLLGRGRASA